MAFVCTNTLKWVWNPGNDIGFSAVASLSYTKCYIELLAFGRNQNTLLACYSKLVHGYSALLGTVSSASDSSSSPRPLCLRLVTEWILGAFPVPSKVKFEQMGPRSIMVVIRSTLLGFRMRPINDRFWLRVGTSVTASLSSSPRPPTV